MCQSQVFECAAALVKTGWVGGETFHEIKGEELWFGERSTMIRVSKTNLRRQHDTHGDAIQ